MSTDSLDIINDLIYDDRIEVTNSGTFPADMTIERLLSTHDSEPQNPIIANVLYKSKILESWGRRIALMVNECQRVGLPAPEFHTDGAFVWVIFRYATSTRQVPDKYPTSRNAYSINWRKHFFRERNDGTYAFKKQGKFHEHIS
jgi:predicted HTH transcriptional regulator